VTRLRPALCVDIDNVIAQTDKVMRRIISEITEGRVQLEYEDIHRFEYWECKDKAGASITKEEWRAAHRIISTPENLLALEPMAGARESLLNLCEHFDTYFVTSRLGGTEEVTASWLRVHGFPCNKLHTVEYREKHLLPRKFSVVIEDDYEQGMLFTGSGAKVYLLEHPWNRGRPAVAQISWAPHWESLLSEILHTKI
jgi:uncharacterized HAD superfamily protein